MQLTDSPPFNALQQAIDQWIETAFLPDLQVQQLRSCLADVGRTIADLQTEITQSKTALQESEERYRRIIETATDGILASDISGNILNFNHKFSEQWRLVESLDSEQELLEKTIDQIQNSDVFLSQLKPEVEHPDLESQIVLELKDGRVAQCKQIEQSLRESQICLRLLNSITTRITAGWSVGQVIESTVQQIGHYFKTLRVLYGVMEEGFLTIVHSVQPEAMPTLQGMVEDLTNAPACLEMIDRRQPIIIQDVTQEAFLEPIAALMISRKTYAVLSVPVQHSNQKLGLLCFNAPKPRQWSDFEVATLMEIADYLSIVLQEAQAQQERQRAEDRLRLLESVVVNGNDSVIITDANPDNPKIIYTNAAFTAATGYSAEEVIGKTPRILQGPKSNRVQLDKIRHALNQGKPIQIELLNYRKDGSEFWVDLNIVPIVDPTGKLTHYVALQRDISDRKWAEKALLATQARFKYLLSSNPSVIYTCQPNRNRPCTFVSENITQQLGYEVWQYLKDPHFWIDRIHPDDLPNVLTKMSQLFATEQLSCEYQFLHQDGSYRWLRDAMKLLRDRQGYPVEIIGSVVDITDRKRVENQLRESLQEKEVMLKEIHHRVKNNLQVISSLLKLQAGYIKDDRILEVFKESQNRVRAMALIHEKLYQSEDLAKTDFAEYIRSLVNDLFRSYSISSRAVSLNLTVEDVRLSIDTAIPCGLIINELVSNSLKHAFSARQPGQISIDLSSKANDRYLLVVQDNGAGLPSDIDFRKTKSLGLQLVCNLTKQLQGTIDLDRENGSTFKINFTDQKHKF
ncbi:PAS domain S-box protein [Phormidesmis priestleyi]